MSRRMAVAKDRQGWHICGPWTDRREIPWPWGPSTAPAECRHRDEPHLHILFSAWEHALTVALMLSHPTQPTP